MSDTTENMESTETQQTELQKADITQDKLDQLINDSFGKGAKKAQTELLESLGVSNVDDLKASLDKVKEMEDAAKTETDKLRESIEAKEAELARLAKENSDLAFNNKVSSLAIEAGVKERDLFAHLYATASTQEGFEPNGFIANLKLEKPFLFGEQPNRPKADSTRTPADTNPINEKVEKAKKAFA